MLDHERRDTDSQRGPAFVLSTGQKRPNNRQDREISLQGPFYIPLLVELMQPLSDVLWRLTFVVCDLLIEVLPKSPVEMRGGMFFYTSCRFWKHKTSLTPGVVLVIAA